MADQQGKRLTMDNVDEYQTLQQVLEANNIYEPQMQLEEMRTLCEILETEVQPVSGEASPPKVPSEDDTIDIVKQMFENHRNKLQQCGSQSREFVSPPDQSEVEVLDEQDPLAVQEGSPSVEQKSPDGNGNQNQQKGTGRRLRKRVPQNYANQMKQPEPRRQTRKQQESKEYKKLRRFLQERDLYKPPMDISEMREVYQAIQQSMQDIKRKPCEPEYEDFTYLFNDYPQQEPLREDIWQATSDLNPIFEDSVNAGQISNFSPPIVPVTKTQPELLISSPGWTLSATPIVDSDSETEYSPDNPGPCCKVIHVVFADIHPEPREDLPDESPRQPCKNRLNRSLRLPSVPTDAWDAIDEFF